jgi:hypothetical protein
MFNNSSPIKYVAGGIAAVALAFGAYALGNSKSDGSSSGTASAAQFGRMAPQSGSSGSQSQPGTPPQAGGQMPPGFGRPATGTAAAKAKAAALAKYSGTVERVMKLSDGSYVVHVITSRGEQHVTVSKDFKVTGTQQGGPGGHDGAPGAPPSGAAPQNGAGPPSGSTPQGSGSIQ